jgi:hypothetical protein
MALIFTSCKKEDEKSPVTKSIGVAYCGEPTVVALISGGTIDAGTVTIVNDELFLYVTFELLEGYTMNRTNLYLGDKMPAFNGLGDLPNRADHQSVTSYTYQFELSGLPEGYFYVAAFAQMQGGANAWGEGDAFGNSGGMAFIYLIQECEQEPDPDPKLGPPYSSVTATNPGDSHVVYNSNHFTYAKLNYADLEAGVTIDLSMVYGNKIVECGTAVVTLENGTLVVEINKFGVGNYGLIAFNKEPNSKVPKNGNLHSCKEAELIKELGATTGFKHNNILSVPCPQPNELGLIYLYLHCETIRFYQ